MTIGNNIITVESIGKSTHILINGVVHISIKNNDLRAIQAWKMGKKSGRYCAELYMMSVVDGVSSTWTMELEYDNPELSKTILDILKQYI